MTRTQGTMGATNPDSGIAAHCDAIVKNGFVMTMDEERRIFSPGPVAG